MQRRQGLPMSEMFRITLPDGSIREVEPGTTPADVAAAIGPGLARAAIAARVNGELRDIGRPLEGDAELAAIEEEMRRLIRADKPLTREVWTRDRLIGWFRDHGESFKAEWAAE